MLKKRILTPKQLKNHNFSLGQLGEHQAVIFLEKNSYQLLAKNIRYGNKEVDIIALDKKLREIVFVEVKTRNKDLFGDPSKAVNQAKLRSMQSVAKLYMRRNKINLDYRFDIISIISGRIRHYQNVTW